MAWRIGISKWLRSESNTPCRRSGAEESGLIAAGADPAKHIRFRPLEWVCVGATSNFQDTLSTAIIAVQCKAGYAGAPLPACLPPAPAQAVFLLQSTGPAVSGSLYMGTWEIPDSQDQWRSCRVVAAVDGQSCTVLFQNDVVTTQSFLPFVAGAWPAVGT